MILKKMHEKDDLECAIYNTKWKYFLKYETTFSYDFYFIICFLQIFINEAWDKNQLYINDRHYAWNMPDGAIWDFTEKLIENNYIIKNCYNVKNGGSALLDMRLTGYSNKFGVHMYISMYIEKNQKIIEIEFQEKLEDMNAFNTFLNYAEILAYKMMKDENYIDTDEANEKIKVCIEKCNDESIKQKCKELNIL